MAKIILTHEVSGLGTSGDIVEVKDGYARNYLLPQGFAVMWTKGGEKQIESMKAAHTSREIGSLEDAKTLAASLKSTPVQIAVKAGAGGRLFGSVSTGDLAQAVADAGIGQIDKRKINILTPIKSTGTFQAAVKLHEEVSATFDINVVAE